MKSTNYLRNLIVICILFIFSCKDDKQSDDGGIIENPNFFSDHLGDSITRDFNGTILDANNSPIANVDITIGNKTSTTDSIGQFSIRKAEVHTKFAYIIVKKNGYKEIGLSIIPKDGINTVTIQIHKTGEPSLFWFSKDNHNLPNSLN